MSKYLISIPFDLQDKLLVLHVVALPGFFECSFHLQQKLISDTDLDFTLLLLVLTSSHVNRIHTKKDKSVSI